jgi:hypothetical protein
VAVGVCAQEAADQSCATAHDVPRARTLKYGYSCTSPRPHERTPAAAVTLALVAVVAVAPVTAITNAT